jgi:aryl-alcohol dehydrogenase-like predicted oxidoreductase
LTSIKSLLGRTDAAARDAQHLNLSVAAETGRTAAQVAINWLLMSPAVSAPIIGVRTMEQLHDDLGAVGWSLSETPTGMSE